MDGVCSIHGRDGKFVQNFVWKGRRPIGRSKERCEDNSKTD
jgi:hypothetical protein